MTGEHFKPNLMFSYYLFSGAPQMYTNHSSLFCRSWGKRFKTSVPDTYPQTILKVSSYNCRFLLFCIDGAGNTPKLLAKWPGCQCCLCLTCFLYRIGVIDIPLNRLITRTTCLVVNVSSVSCHCKNIGNKSEYIHTPNLPVLSAYLPCRPTCLVCAFY